MSKILFALVLLVLALLLNACQPNGEQQTQQPPVAFHEHDECHVCGMLITRYPGPKGEAYQRNSGEVLKFCSTRDLFAYLLEPGQAAQVGSVYVHDMARSEWKSPDDTHLIPAQQAWYVVGHPLRGAMGPSPASFAKREDAAAFAQQHGGKLLKYEEIDLAALN